MSNPYVPVKHWCNESKKYILKLQSEDNSRDQIYVIGYLLKDYRNPERMLVEIYDHMAMIKAADCATKEEALFAIGGQPKRRSKRPVESSKQNGAADAADKLHSAALAFAKAIK